MTRLGYQIASSSYPGVARDGIFDIVVQQAKEADISGFDTVMVIGGSGEKKTLRMVAQYADDSNTTAGPDEIGEQFSAWLELGIDGFTLNSIVNGHVPGRVSLLGEALSAVVTARARS
jgi:hypothetical protein